MPDKPEVYRQIPRFPILFQRPAIPPIPIEVSIRKPEYLSNDIKQYMKHTIEPCNPHDGVGYGQSEPSEL